MSDQRPWMDAYDRVATVEHVGPDVYRIRNLRNFSYTPGKLIASRWETVDVSPKDIERVWFATASLRQFGFLKEVFAHVYTGFRFQSGMELGLSIEARRHENEPYDPLMRGMAGAYELTYVWGTLQDFTERREYYQDQTLKRYSLSLSREQSTALLHTFFTATNENAKKPERYHTVRTQCGNKLMELFQSAGIPVGGWHPSWQLPGLLPRLLNRKGIIDTENKTVLTPQ